MTAPFAGAAARSVHWLRRQPAGWKGMRWESPRGMMSIDSETRDVVQTVYIRRVERVGGELRNVDKTADVTIAVTAHSQPLIALTRGVIVVLTFSTSRSSALNLTVAYASATQIGT